jgi:hypothetical protein
MSNLDQVRRLLGALSPEELRVLQEDLAALVAASEPGGSAHDDEPHRERGGHIELKLINGYGPYKYLRRMEGGKLRSIYLGKASLADSKHHAPKRSRKKPQ